MDRVYLAKFRQGSGVMAMNAIDFYKEDGRIIKHRWANGGGDKKEVKEVPESIEGYTSEALK